MAIRQDLNPRLGLKAPDPDRGEMASWVSGDGVRYQVMKAIDQSRCGMVIGDLCSELSMIDT